MDYSCGHESIEYRYTRAGMFRKTDSGAKAAEFTKLEMK
jgi:hypothetical protein